MTSKDLTAPEAVERLADRYDKMSTWNGDWKHEAADTLRALSAALEAEKEHGRKFMWHARYTCSRAEAAETKLKEAVEVMQRVKDYRYDPNIGIELNMLEAFLASLEGDKP